MGLDREYRLETELHRLLDDLALPESEVPANVPGKRTQVEQLIAQLSAQRHAEHVAAGPGRRTLVERLLAAATRFSFDDFRVVALRDVVRSLDARPGLQAATVAAADHDVARRATARGTVMDAGADAGGRAMWRVAERRAATLYRRAFDAGEVSPDDPAVQEALSRAGSGAPLPDVVRRRMENELGISLAGVRVHADAVAAQAARAVRAEAFTVGEDIFFAEGTYDPESRAGQKLLAHELTHVLQNLQGRSDTGGAVRVSQPGDALEQEADQIAERVDGMHVRDAHGGHSEAPGAPAGDAHALRGEPAQARPARRNKAVFARPTHAQPARPASGARTLQRKAARPRAEVRDGDPATIQPTLRRVVQRVPSPPSHAVGDARGTFKHQLTHATEQADARLGTLKATVRDAKGTRVGAKAKAHGKQDKAKVAAHKHATDAVRKQHAADAEQHKNAGNGAASQDADQLGPVEQCDPHAPIQFKKIADWDKYLPQPMKDQDERERARLLALIQRKLEHERSESQKALTRLHAAQIKQAAAIRAMKGGLGGQILAGQRAALARIAASEASQGAAVAGAYASAQARVNGAASAAKAQVNSAYAATVAAIHNANQAAAQKLGDSQTQATRDVGNAETTEIAAVGAVYAGARAKVDAAASRESSFAAGLADTVPLPYEGDKLDAAKTAAHDTADGWAKEIPGKMQEDAQKNIYGNQPETEAGVHDIATKQKEQIKTVYDKLKQALDTAHSQALDGASTARSEALSQISSIAASTCASLAAQSAAQVAAVHHQAAAARAGIIKAGKAAHSGVIHACDKAAVGLEQGALGLVKGARLVEAPDPGETARAVDKNGDELKTSSRSIIDGLKLQASQSATGLAAQAQSAAHGMAGIAAQAKTASAQIAQGASQSIAQAGQSTARSLHKMGEAFGKQAESIADGGDQAFQGIVKDVKAAYQKATESLKKGIDEGVQGLAKGYHDAISDKERQAIRDNAKKAADAVKPWWQKALAFVLVIVVSILITVVVTALTGGLGTGPVMIALIAIGSGALAGGLSSAAGQVVNNLVMGKGAFEDFSWKEVGIGALAGAFTAGIASGVSAVGGATIRAAMTEGSATFATAGGLAIRTGVNFGAGMGADALAQLAINHKYEFSMQNMITTLGFSAVMSTTKFMDAQNRIGDGIRTSVGLKPIHVNTPSVEGARPTTESTGHATTQTGHGSSEPTGHGTTQTGHGSSEPTGHGTTQTGRGSSEPTGHGTTEPTGKGAEPTGKGHEETGGKGHEETGGKGHEETGGKGHEETGGKGHEEPTGRGHEEPTGQGHDDQGSGRSKEQQEHDQSRDTDMKADGYPEGTRAKADDTATKIEEGNTPSKDGLRDTEANARGKAELEKMLKDPKLSAEERARIQKELADKLRNEPDPTGKLDQDLHQTKTKIENETKAGEPKPGESTGKTGETKAGEPKPGEATSEPPAPKPEAGLKDTKLTERFAGEMKSLEGNWSKMTPDERASAVADIINKHLADAGVPELKVKARPLGEGTNGHLDFQRWEITINEGKLNAPTIDSAKLGELSNTVYHEARHGEQWYLMARHLAEAGMSPHDIFLRTRIPEPVCEAAAAEPKMSSSKAAEAQTYYDSVYGANAAKRNQVLNDLNTNPTAVEKAAVEFNAIKDDPTVSLAEKQARYKAWEDAYNKMDQNYQDYRNLPEEADAWQTGNAAEEAYKAAPKPDPALDPAKTQPMGKSAGDKTQPPTTGEATKPPTHSEPGKTEGPVPEAPAMTENPGSDSTLRPPGEEGSRGTSRGTVDDRLPAAKGLDDATALQLAKIDPDTLSTLKAASPAELEKLAALIKSEPALADRMTGRKNLLGALRKMRGETPRDLDGAMFRQRLTDRGGKPRIADALDRANLSGETLGRLTDSDLDALKIADESLVNARKGYGPSDGDPELLKQARTALDQIADGGLRDQVRSALSHEHGISDVAFLVDPAGALREKFSTLDKATLDELAKRNPDALRALESARPDELQRIAEAFKTAKNPKDVEDILRSYMYKSQKAARKGSERGGTDGLEPPANVADRLEASLENLAIVRERGYPFGFEGKAEYQQFISTLKGELSARGIEGEPKVQGSALHSRTPGDIDVEILVERGEFARLGETFSDAAPSAGQARELQNNIAKQKIPSYQFYSRTGPGHSPSIADAVVHLTQGANGEPLSVQATLIVKNSDFDTGPFL